MTTSPASSEAAMPTEPSISVSRDIAAPADRLFALLVRTVAHPEVDGSGMLRTPVDDIAISGVDDVFALNMWNEEMGDYVMENRVVEFELDRRVVWSPVMRSIEKSEMQDMVGDPGNHLWGWRLEPLDAEHTRVTEMFDCSRSPEDLRRVLKDGERWRPEIEASLANLEKLATGS